MAGNVSPIRSPLSETIRSDRQPQEEETKSLTVRVDDAVRENFPSPQGENTSPQSSAAGPVERQNNLGFQVVPHENPENFLISVKADSEEEADHIVNRVKKLTVKGARGV